MRDKKIEIIYFDDNEYKKVEPINLKNIELKKNYKCWINIQGFEIRDEVSDLEKKFGIHPLIVEDIVDRTKRTKIEKFDNFDFISLHPIEVKKASEKLITYEDIYILLNEDVIITVSDISYPVFENIVERLFLNKLNSYNSINKLNFAIMEKIIDNYYLNFERIGEEVDRIDSKLIKSNNYDIIDELYILRRNMIYMNKYIVPFKSVIKYLYESEDMDKTKENQYYYRDLTDDLDNIIESIEAYKELTKNIIDTVNNRVGDKTNQITKILTIWSTIFLPITFLTGVYGMNFRYMDVLEWEFAFPIFWIISAIIVVIMVVFFKKKKWF